MGEAFTLDYGFLHYLWVKAMKEQKNQQDNKDLAKAKSTEKLLDNLDMN